jgi:hypothetical protein
VGSALGTRRAANGARTEDVKVSQKLHFNPGFLSKRKEKRKVSHTHKVSQKLHFNPGFLSKRKEKEKFHTHTKSLKNYTSIQFFCFDSYYGARTEDLTQSLSKKTKNYTSIQGYLQGGTARQFRFFCLLHRHIYIYIYIYIYSGIDFFFCLLYRG